jgi:hypothetical protein
MGAEQRPAAASGQAQADIGHFFLPQQRFILPAIAAQALGLIRFLRDCLVGRLGAVQPRFFQKTSVLV